MMNNVIEALKARKDRSAWNKGVTLYSLELVEELAENMNGGFVSADDLGAFPDFKKALLNGAKDWSQYSWGGCSLIYDGDIAERLCTPSELKRKKGGLLPPGRGREWLDVQAEALKAAASRAWFVYKHAGAR